MKKTSSNSEAIPQPNIQTQKVEEEALKLKLLNLLIRMERVDRPSKIFLVTNRWMKKK